MAKEGDTLANGPLAGIVSLRAVWWGNARRSGCCGSVQCQVTSSLLQVPGTAAAAGSSYGNQLQL